jgi:hypothetical protein
LECEIERFIAELALGVQTFSRAPHLISGYFKSSDIRRCLIVMIITFYNYTRTADRTSNLALFYFFLPLLGYEPPDRSFQVEVLKFNSVFARHLVRAIDDSSYLAHATIENHIKSGPRKSSPGP